MNVIVEMADQCSKISCSLGAFAHLDDTVSHSSKPIDVRCTG